MWIVTTTLNDKDKDYQDITDNKRFGDNQHEDMFKYLSKIFNDLNSYEAVHIKYIDVYVPHFVLGGDKKK